MTTPVAIWPPQTHNDVVNKINELDVKVQPPFNNFRFFLNGTWQKRGTDNPLLPRIWIKHDPAIVNPPENGEYFKTGVGGDIILVGTV